jgi:DhnA family fructose-bisphosphate aldolase class Ia
MPGAYPVVQSYASGQARNRQFTAVAATAETATWDASVNEVTITVIQEAAGTAELLASVGVCFGAPSDATAAAWLTYTESKAADSGMVVLVPGVPRTFYFSGAGITRLDLKRLFGSEALGVLVEAA